MHGLVTKPVLLASGLLMVGLLLMAQSPLLAYDWTQFNEGSVSQGAAHSSTTQSGNIPTRNVNYGSSNPLEDRVAELEAELAKINSKAAEAKKKAEGQPSVTAGGRIQLDSAGFSQNDMSRDQVGEQQNGVEFRRARIFISGEMFNVVEYKAEYDFADTGRVGATTLQSTAFKDVYIAIKELPILGHVRIGHFKEPIGLEQLTSAKFISFMERSLADEYGFVPGRNTGVMAHDTWADEDGTWAIGCFVSEMTAEPPIFQDDNGGYSLSMRGTYLPWYDEATEGRGLWHLGMSYSYRDNANDLLRFRQRPECHLADYVVDTGTIIDSPSWQLLGLESAVVYGPLSFQTEWFCSFVRRTANANAFYNGGYAYVSYFLTGEHRKYKRDGGCFDRIKPNENFFRVRAEDGNVYTGKGAWEVLYRISYIDLSDETTADLAGTVCDHTLGLNWYLNPYTRMMFNYVNSTADDRVGANGNMNIFEVRAQVDF